MESNTRTVLRCPKCNKPFDQQSSLKRHGYYCRSRKSEPEQRSRSCAACVRSKVRCDVKHPKCSRCVSRDLDCQYPARATQPKRRPLTKQANAAIQDIHDTNQDLYTIQSDPLILSDPYFGDLSWDVDWTDTALDMDIDDIINAPTDQVQLKQVTSPPLAGARSRLCQAICTPTHGVPLSPTRNTRSLVHRPRLEVRVQRTANLIISTLKSYPRMMLQHNTLPPFIHQHIMRFESGDMDLEPLMNCMNLVHMLSSGYQGSRKLFWKNVRLECEQILDQNSTFSSWKLLAAMQSVTIYLLTRLDEGERDYSNADSLLVSAVAALSQRLNSLSANNVEDVASNSDFDAVWKSWIWEESIRRICVIYRIVNMLVYFEPASMCNLRDDLVMAPLPARRQLWEANSSLTWRSQVDSKPGIDASFGLAKDGELVRVDESRLHDNTALDPFTGLGRENSGDTSGNWEQWCSGMDSFGGLIMLAASFVV